MLWSKKRSTACERASPAAATTALPASHRHHTGINLYTYVGIPRHNRLAHRRQTTITTSCTAMSNEFEDKRDSEDLFWTTYLKAAEDEDKYLPRSWETNTGSILTFTGLFAATVAAFVIESYKSLSPDSGAQTVALLSQLLTVNANASASVIVSTGPTSAFMLPVTAVIVNALWFASLLISLACALLATLIQEWSRNYVRDIAGRQTLNES
ncbi:hypothetical protein PENSPDRAFT_571709, partial [Peniophora sp. CONT]